MSDEYESLNSRIPDFASALAQRISQKTMPAQSNDSKFDPYKLMIKKKTGEIEQPDPVSIQQWPEKDEKLLKDYCQRMGIVGFSTKLNPLVALAMLKNQLGDNYTDVPLEERIPTGYEKLNSSTSKKQILHG